MITTLVSRPSTCIIARALVNNFPTETTEDKLITEPSGGKYTFYWVVTIVLMLFWNRYSRSWNSGSFNTGRFTDYNRRREPFNCRWPAPGTTTGPAFYLGRDYSNRLNDLRTAGRPTDLASLINEFVRIMVFRFLTDAGN